MATHGDDIDFLEVDREKGDGVAFAREHRIRYQPAFVVYAADGSLLRAELGPYDEDGLRALVSSLLP